MLILPLKYLLLYNLIRVISASCLSATFKTDRYSLSVLFEEFLPLNFSLNLQMNFFTYAGFLLILTQQDILSSSVSNIV